MVPTGIFYERKSKVKYFKIANEYDNFNVYISKDGTNYWTPIWTIFGGELITDKERQRLVPDGSRIIYGGKDIPVNGTTRPLIMQEVNIPKTKTYWMFGARFAASE